MEPGVRRDLSRWQSAHAIRTFGVLSVLLAGTARADLFEIRPIEFINEPGYRMVASGTITTFPGTSTITDWSLSVTTVELLARYTPANTANYSSGPIAVDGTELRVPTSPDGIADGGSLLFRSRNPWKDFGVAVANFSAGSVAGGEISYMAGTSGDVIPLSEANGTQFAVAQSASIGEREFTLVPRTFPGGAVLSGTLWTDGTNGTLAPANITDWEIQIEQITRDFFGPGNSQLVASPLQLDPTVPALTLENPDGYLAFSKGRIGFHPYLLQLADFSDSSPRGGQAAYYQGRFATWVLPLGAPTGSWTVTGNDPVTAVPEASPGLGFFLPFFAVSILSRRRK